MALEEYLVPYCSRTNICFDCQRACGGCSWSACDPVTEKPLFRPVPGWTAEPSMLYPAGGAAKRTSEVWTYHVTACPLFVRDEPRESRPMYETEEAEKPC